MVRIGIQPGMTYLALNVMNHERMLERRAEQNGNDLKVEWIVSANGSVLNDGVLSGNIDIAGTGIPAFVTLWAKGRGTVDARGIAAYGSLPGMLISRNPNVHSVQDFTNADRIALPAPKASIQAILLEMMAAKIWGLDQHERLNPLMVGLAHPDALIAMLSGRSCLLYTSLASGHISWRRLFRTWAPGCRSRSRTGWSSNSVIPVSRWG